MAPIGANDPFELTQGRAVLRPPQPISVRAALLSARGLADSASRAVTSADLCADLRQALRDALGADQVHLLEVGNGGRGGPVTVQPFAGGHASDDYDLDVDCGPSGVASVLRTGRTLAVADARGTASLRAELVERYDVASTMFVPLSYGGEIRRVATLVWHAPREFDDEVILLAEVLMGQAAAGLARLDAEQRHAAGAAQDRALVRAARALNASLDLHEVLRTLSREACQAVGADLAGVYLGDAEHGVVATAGHNVPDEWHGLALAPGEGAAGQAILHGCAWSSDEYRRDERRAKHPTLDNFRTALAVPMVWDDERRGALSVGWTAMRRVTPEDERTVTAIADLASFACRNAETHERVEHAARTDALTGLLNHGAMQIRLREEIARARRDGTPLTCAIVDLDDFKRINDICGHLAGDDVLRRVAVTLGHQLRPYDQVARYGGDEFVLLLPGSDAAAARQVCERVCEAVARDMGDGADPATRSSCSIGIAQWHEPLVSDALLERADRALLWAKRSGKGRVAVVDAG